MKIVAFNESFKWIRFCEECEVLELSLFLSFEYGKIATKNKRIYMCARKTLIKFFTVFGS